METTPKLVYDLTQAACETAAERIAEAINSELIAPHRIYGVPRGGIPAAYLVSRYLEECSIVASPDQANVFIDDIVDSGATRLRFATRYPETSFYALADFASIPNGRPWVVFPWERALDGKDSSAEDVVIRLLQHIGEDPKREGLKETPQRVLKAWTEWTSGYAKDVQSVMKTFLDGSEGYDEMIWQKDLPFYSHCEHHLAPFFGTATIAYIPNKEVIGASKLDRVLDIFARRLQVQERLTTQVADALQNALKPRGVGVVIRARHLCMESRGISKQGQQMITCALRGAMKEDPKAREEFLLLAR